MDRDQGSRDRVATHASSERRPRWRRIWHAPERAPAERHPPSPWYQWRMSMDRRLQALLDLAIVLAVCAAAVFVVDVFGQASANRPYRLHGTNGCLSCGMRRRSRHFFGRRRDDDLAEGRSLLARHHNWKTRREADGVRKAAPGAARPHADAKRPGPVRALDQHTKLMLRPLASSTSMKRGASGPGGRSKTKSTCRWGSSSSILLPHPENRHPASPVLGACLSTGPGNTQSGCSAGETRVRRSRLSEPRITRGTARGPQALIAREGHPR